ncbi:MAG: chemotaxis protein CheA, partial [Gimesia chilikensis]
MAEAPAQEVRAPEPTPATPEVVADAADDGAKSSKVSVADLSIRVNVNVVDSLMNLVGELVLTRNQLLQLARGDEESKYAAPITHLNRVTTDLQEGVMKTRMQPIGNAWNKLPRLVRDLSQVTHKHIELVMTGAETELDRTVLDAIKDPLT